jgi:signal transduction histidine kinase
MASTIWLIVTLTAAFSIAASLWVGSLARDIVLQQHVRRLSLETDQWAADIDQALAARVGATHMMSTLLEHEPAGAPAAVLRSAFAQLVRSYPDLDWIALVDRDGVVLWGSAALPEGRDVSRNAWFLEGRAGPWLGVVDATGAGAGAAGVTAAPSATPPSSASGTVMGLGDFAAPIYSTSGEPMGVVAARLTWRVAPDHLPRLTEATGTLGTAQALLLDNDGSVVVGPASLRGRKWPGIPADARHGGAAAPQFEVGAQGGPALVARAPVGVGDAHARPRWRIQLSEPKARVYERADALADRIVAISACLAALTACIGGLGAARLTQRLLRLTRSVAAVGRDAERPLEVPKGRDEVAQLGTAFAALLRDLRAERGELRALSEELERRVDVRTREVERLAEEARYAAVVRERLQIARDLHDTLAHSMMAMLSEIRMLRTLQIHDPGAVGQELARAEQLAHEGLNEARNAIAQMRFNTVRDTGLGTALTKTLGALSDETGLKVEFRTDAEGARLGDERAEAVFRIAEEALRNVARHAKATRVVVTLATGDHGQCELRIEDDGVGFDPEAEYEGHFGLIGIREQAEMIGARLRIESTTLRGTTLSVAWSSADHFTLYPRASRHAALARK